MKLILLFFSLFVLIKGQILPNDQLKAAKELISTLYGVTTDDVCNFNGFSCTQLDSNSDLATVISLQLQSKKSLDGRGYSSDRKTINNDLTIFKDLQYIELFDVEISSNFFYNLYKLTKLNIIHIDYHLLPLTKEFKLPESLTFISIKYFGGKVASSFFNSNLNTLDIKNSLKGFDVTNGSDIVINNKLTALSLPIVSSNTQALFDSLGAKLKNIYRIILILDESTTKTKKNIQIPTFKPSSFSSLKLLNIYFQTGSLEKPNFPYTINNLVGLNQIIFNSNQYTMDVSKPFIDFTKINPSLFFRATFKCEYLSSCKKKPCIKFPKKTIVSVQDCQGFDKSYVEVSHIMNKLYTV
ncbi:hypothetical protein DICPUDRAFT_94639 [Dictyostelium purpureum]|uniref:Leucine-rich repeat-containing N-terminal plant-type domain-containing protein n=1 Tax=Dictyostelium purpureum TaxID=5786 RepID=F0ZLW2_DICPU|nr:uncharacterized protein DICPUDRAFT_94639 [Dictyostelium purpureum]EGC35055.1 hypothetical protein DICPUDRAFT_94639 [Dictyostelium purpureum]|eukprot:XP_003288423.1 hypothetical protein DICPUDRAFT_94639 [Dictyostelium purpureum]